VGASEKHEAAHHGTNPNAGEGWYEWIREGSATTHIAYVHENGEVYDPEHGWNPPDFLLAAARDRVFKLVRAEALA